MPEDIVWIPAPSDSQVAKILTHSGDEVRSNSILLVLTNPDMEVDANDHEWQVKQAEADYADTKVQLQSQTFDQQSTVDSTRSDLNQAEADHGSRRAAAEAESESGNGRPAVPGELSEAGR